MASQLETSGTLGGRHVFRRKSAFSCAKGAARK
jgi:hypothetical protein